MLEYSNIHMIGDMLISESQKEIPCQLQKFMEAEALSRSGAQIPSKPLFISCPCKRCSPFSLS